MPKATSTKTKVKTKPKPNTKTTSSAVLSPQKATPKPAASREIMMQILLAKVENSKTLDWFELSIMLTKGNTHSDTSKKGTKRRKSTGGEIDGFSGTELRDVFQEVCPLT